MKSCSKSFLETVEDAGRNRSWVLVDATDKVVGRIASEVASVLRGKRNVRYTPYVDTGDFVVVVNAEKIRFTRGKEEKKVYRKHTGFVGNMKTYVARDLLKTKPEEVIIHAVQGMLPKTALGRQQLTKLKVYTGSEHPHSAQQPKPMKQ